MNGLESGLADRFEMRMVFLQVVRMRMDLFANHKGNNMEVSVANTSGGN